MLEKKGQVGKTWRKVDPEQSGHWCLKRMSANLCGQPDKESLTEQLNMSTRPGPDGLLRCSWSTATAELLDYHDTEWAFPVTDDRHLFEIICLESFQSGLSWQTILHKRNNFRAAFHQFDFDRIAVYTSTDINRLLADPGIVRHRGKIEASIHNARDARKIVDQYGSLAAFFWHFEPAPENLADPGAVSTSEASITLAGALKTRGWRFIGPTTAHAFLQAAGLMNGHARACGLQAQVEYARDNFTRPEPVHPPP